MIEMPETGAAATSLEHSPPASSSAPATPATPATPAAPATPAGQAPAAGHGPAEGPAPAAGRGRRRQRLMVILLVVACAVAVAAAAVIAVLLAQRPQRAHAAAHPLRATVFRLRPGQCFDSSPNGIAGAHVVPCAQPHDAEIYGAFRVAGQRWPGTAALGTQARLGCQARLSGYLNPQLATSDLAETYAYPNQGAWSAGAHTVICEIRGTQGRLSGSVRAFGG
jgi:Septum formation